MKPIRFTVNGSAVEVDGPPLRRLTDVLRLDLGLTGTKVGCDAGDCGACSVLLDGAVVCACLVPLGRLADKHVITVEGIGDGEQLSSLQRSFIHHGAAQCGICTPGMLIAAKALLEKVQSPDPHQVEDALGGVLCRCTGYRKIVDAVVAAPTFDADDLPPPPGKAIGNRVPRVDGRLKVSGDDIFGADEAPQDALVLKVVRSPFHRATFTFGDIETYVATTPGVVAVFTASDVPGRNRFGVIPATADQPVFAKTEVRHRGEAVAMVAGHADDMSVLDLEEFPVVWTELEAVHDPEAALAPGAHQIHAARPGNVLVEGYVARGDLEAGFKTAGVVVESEYTTTFVEHAYIEPEAGFARRVGDRIEIQATTQTPHMDRTEIAAILGIEPEKVRIIPTAVGGGFGSKLDLSVQPFLAVAAWHLDLPVRITYTRPESMMSTTKRHPARLRARVGATRSGDLIAMDFSGTFDTGAYASWGPTVANRAPVHAGGPYVYRAYRARTRAVHTNAPPAGAFRGFGVPQSAVCQESLFDELADAVGMDRLEFRIRNALTAGKPTVTGQVFESGVGFGECLEALRPGWTHARAEAAEFNQTNSLRRRGVGVAGMWYGCGNTALPNPSTMKVGLHRNGGIVVFQGAVDIGQGANTAMLQICADTLGMDISALTYVGADTATTPDAGKTSASRQTFVSGNALFEASRLLRLEMLEMTHASEDAHFELTNGPSGGSTLMVHDRGETREFDLLNVPADPAGFVALRDATYDPPTSPLDENGQGDPYAVFGFGAQMAELEIDTRLGTVQLIRITAAHDVGRAVNPTLIEGQIEGGIAQGIGMALMEEYVPGRNENLHDYLIPTFGDVPEVVNILIESHDPIGPYGAKGIGEHTLIPTAPAILNAIRDAAGAPVRNLPATPARILEAIRQGAISS